MPSPTTIERFLQRAKDVSYTATYPRQHLGSVLVYGNKIIAVGSNSNKTNPKQMYFNKYRNFSTYTAKNNGAAHAELTVLLKTRFLDIDWSKTTLYIYREFKDGTRALSKPCAACNVACAERGIGTIIYSTAEGYNIWRLTENGYVCV